MSDSLWRCQQRQNDSRWRFSAQRAGQVISFYPGDIIEVGESYNYLGQVSSSTWCGQPCPVRVLILQVKSYPSHSSQKLIGTLLPPRRYMPTQIAFDRPKTLIDLIES